MSGELDSYIDSLKSEGTPGQFTIDYVSARQRLRDSLGGSTVSPRQYLGPLSRFVMSAVTAGAWEVRLHQDGSGLTLTHDGEHPDENLLANLFTHWLSGSEQGLHLALGINDWLRSKQKVRLSTRHGEFVYTPDQLIHSNNPSDRVKVKVSGIYGSGVFETLGKKARYAPLALQLENESIKTRSLSVHPETCCQIRLFGPWARR